MEVNNIELTKEKETLFIPLYAKAIDYRSKHSILYDKTANDIINSMDHDFSKYKGLGGNAVLIRTRQMDIWINEFIHNNNNPVVLNLGCGLDARINRVNPESSVRWYDIDFPEVIELRKNFYSERIGCCTIGTSITEDNWYKEIPNNNSVIIAADGVLEYLTNNEIKVLFDRLLTYFHNGEITFDIMSSLAVDIGKRGLKETTGAEHKWMIDDTKEIDGYNNKLKRQYDFSIFNVPCIKEMNIGIKIFCKTALLLTRQK
jgi:O-methyltransferase involved in polyketide biosynthesis